MNSSLTCEYASLPPFVPLQLILSARQTVHSLVSSTHPSLHHCALTQVNTSPHPTPHFYPLPSPARPAWPDCEGSRANCGPQLSLRRHGSPHGCHSDRSDPVIWAWLLRMAENVVKVSGWRQGTRTHPWWLWPLTVCSISAHLLILKRFLCTPIQSCSDQGILIQP